MEYNLVEEKRNKLNFDIRELLSMIDFIDGDKNEYKVYDRNVDEVEFLDQQINLVNKAKEKLFNIFND